ncbi:MAG TPA: calcium-binding protein [Bauldia sp.]|nr:calcium-binding protein [Bauldia sp.]
MATLTVNQQVQDFTGDTTPGVTAIVFAFTGTSNAHFDSTQFGANISDAVALTGDEFINRINVDMGSDPSFTAAAWTFTNWSGTDIVRITGAAIGQTIVGSIQENEITGGGGADDMTGGDLDDVFFFSANTDCALGEEINGKAGFDTLAITSGVDTIDFSAATLSNIEAVRFGQSETVVFAAVQLGTHRITDIEGNLASAHTLVVNGSSANLSLLSFTFWDGNDTIVINGTAANDALTGSGQDDIINGGEGADSLNGSGGADTLRGGAGGDTYTVDAGDVVDESAAGSDGTDTISASFSFSLGDTVHVKGSVENLTLVGSALNGAGNGLANTITGNAANNTLDGSGGGDTLRGFAGNDTYVVRQANDVVDEAAAGSGGTDTVVAHVSFSLAQTFGAVEELILAGGALNGTGNGLANTITGNTGANTLDGAAGGDTMRGLGGDDTYVIDELGDVVDESAAGSGGTDTILSSINVNLGGGTASLVSLAPAVGALGAVENVTLLGNAVEATGNALANVITGNGADNTLDGGDGADSLAGGDGGDRLIGGFGPDRIAGGNGIDTFAFLALSESGNKPSARDTILDFTAEDFIDLSAIDAKKGGKNDKFKFIGKDAFEENKGELRYQNKKGDVVVSGDVNGDGKADFSILLDGLNKVVRGDFVL